jgi:hypothetical protein
MSYLSVLENRRGNQEWTIQKICQHWLHKTQDERLTKQKYTTQYVLGNTIRKQTKIR